MSLPSTMRALRQTSLDGPQDLRLVTDAPVPAPGPGHVLIRVTAAGVNFVDVSQSRGAFAGGPRPPYVAGIEAAGEVVALGEGVGGPEIGAHVVAATAPAGGAFAEYLVVPAAAALPVPQGWDDEDALGLVVNWPTALAALKLGAVAAGQTVLVHAAAGATGQAALKLAKHYGAIVIASAAPEKHHLLADADHVLDSRGPDLTESVLALTGGVDLVLECSGGAGLETSLAAVKRVTGRVVVHGLAGGEAPITNWDLVYRHQVHVIGLNLGVLIQHAPQLFGEIMAELFTLMAAGVVTPARPTVHPLADGPSVLQRLESRATAGKQALRVHGPGSA